MIEIESSFQLTITSITDYAAREFQRAMRGELCAAILPASFTSDYQVAEARAQAARARARRARQRACLFVLFPSHR